MYGCVIESRAHQTARVVAGSDYLPRGVAILYNDFSVIAIREANRAADVIRAGDIACGVAVFHIHTAEFPRDAADFVQPPRVALGVAFFDYAVVLECIL